jgi:hypothetical protein
MCRLLQTFGVAGRNSGGVAARDPDRLIKWFIGVVVIAVGVNLLSGLLWSRSGHGFRRLPLLRRC